MSKNFGLSKRKTIRWLRRKRYPKRGTGVVLTRQTEMADINSKHNIKTQTQINRGGRDTAVEKTQQPIYKYNIHGT